MYDIPRAPRPLASPQKGHYRPLRTPSATTVSPLVNPQFFLIPPHRYTSPTPVFRHPKPYVPPLHPKNPRARPESLALAPIAPHGPVFRRRAELSPAHRVFPCPFYPTTIPSHSPTSPALIFPTHHPPSSPRYQVPLVAAVHVSSTPCQHQHVTSFPHPFASYALSTGDSVDKRYLELVVASTGGHTCRQCFISPRRSWSFELEFRSFVSVGFLAP
jgi:hypothetical protein